jgi:hypothetical protein
LREPFGEKLPTELTNAIATSVEGLMDREAAEEIRAKLMKERSAMVELGNTEEELGLFSMWCVDSF